MTFRTLALAALLALVPAALSAQQMEPCPTARPAKAKGLSRAC